MQSRLDQNSLLQIFLWAPTPKIHWLCRLSRLTQSSLLWQRKRHYFLQWDKGLIITDCGRGNRRYVPTLPVPGKNLKNKNLLLQSRDQMTKLGNVWNFFYNSLTLIDLIGHYVDENFVQVMLLLLLMFHLSLSQLVLRENSPPKGESNGAPITPLPERV